MATTGRLHVAEAPSSSSSRMLSCPSASPYASRPEIGPFWGCLQLYAEGFYGVLVPDVEDADAAGDSKEEAIQETTKKLSSQLKRMPRDAWPAASDLQTAAAKARAVVQADGGEFIHEESWEMVQVPVDFSLVADLPSAMLEQLHKEYCT